jgi:lipid-binding SYLF domain-containing protein
MLKNIPFVLALGLVLSVPMIASASDREDDVQRIDRSTQVFKEIMDTPDKAIPHRLLESTKCIAIVPGEKKFAFVFGGNFGRGVAICRTTTGWSAPMFIAVEGGSVGYQIGGSSTDIVMLFMNDHALQSLLGDKFKLGGDASVAAGPVGRDAAADTDIRLKAEILTYSRSHGVFAGVSLEGTVVQADKSGDRSMYGDSTTRRQILDGGVSVPDSAHALVREIDVRSAQARAND